MRRLSTSATVAIFTIILLLSIGVTCSQAAERMMEKGQKANQAKLEQDARAREVETLIKTGKMIEAEGKKTNDRTMMENGRLMVKQGQMMKAGKWPQ